MQLLLRAMSGEEVSMEDQLVLAILLANELYPYPPGYFDRPKTFLQRERDKNLVRRNAGRFHMAEPSAKKLRAQRANIKKRWDDVRRRKRQDLGLE